MAKRTSTAKKAGKSTSAEAHDVNPGVKSLGSWIVYRPSPLQALSVNADQLDVTENGTLIFLTGGSNAPPQVVVAGHQYLYCTRVR